MSLSRRELCGFFPAALLPALIADKQTEQQPSLPSTMYPFNQLPVHTSGPAAIRSVLQGKLASGESLEVHETTLAPGGAPHPPHRHPHSEMWLVREGTVEISVNNTSTRLGPGSVGFVGSNDEHGIKTWARLQPRILLLPSGPALRDTDDQNYRLSP